MGALSFLETDAASGCAAATFCSGRTPSQVGFQAKVGGSAGTAHSLSVNPGAANEIILMWEIPVGPATWKAGNWTVRVNVTTANANITLTEVYLCRVRADPDCTSLGEIGSLTGQSVSCGTTGVKLFTVSGAAQAPGVNERVFALVVASNSAGTTQSVGVTSDQLIDSPFEEILMGWLPTDQGLALGRISRTVAQAQISPGIGIGKFIPPWQRLDEDVIPVKPRLLRNIREEIAEEWPKPQIQLPAWRQPEEALPVEVRPTLYRPLTGTGSQESPELWPESRMVIPGWRAPEEAFPLKTRLLEPLQVTGFGISKPTALLWEDFVQDVLPIIPRLRPFRRMASTIGDAEDQPFPVFAFPSWRMPEEAFPLRSRLLRPPHVISVGIGKPFIGPWQQLVYETEAPMHRELFKPLPIASMGISKPYAGPWQVLVYETEAPKLRLMYRIGGTVFAGGAAVVRAQWERFALETEGPQLHPIFRQGLSLVHYADTPLFVTGPNIVLVTHEQARTSAPVSEAGRPL